MATTGTLYHNRNPAQKYGCGIAEHKNWQVQFACCVSQPKQRCFLSKVSEFAVEILGKASQPARMQSIQKLFQDNKVASFVSPDL